ncbi:MerR family transcriptional regulator [bacterium]|nr:MerR family transcriptional regulator [bacterium]
MRISDVSAQTGIPVSTIRFYEKRGIIAQPTRDAQSLGLPLKEIATLLQGSWETGEMAKVAADYRQTVRIRIAALQRIDAVLAALTSCHCNSFADCDVGAADCKRET